MTQLKLFCKIVAAMIDNFLNKLFNKSFWHSVTKDQRNFTT